MKVFTSVLLLCLTVRIDASERIVNGQTAPEGKFPYQVALKYRNRFFCGGSIINERWILTAAHCLQGLTSEFIKVYAGINKIDDVNAKVYKAEYITYHEKFSMKYMFNDVGLIRVSNKIDFNEKVQPIALPSDNNLSVPGTPVVLSGWGLTHVNGSPPKNLQKINLKIVNQKTCKQYWNSILPITEAHICTFTKYGEGSCRGDSGGPLVAGNVQVGIVSFGQPCAVGYPDVFTRVSRFLDWIQIQQKKFQ